MQYDERKAILLPLVKELLEDRIDSLQFNEESVRELPEEDFNATISAEIVEELKPKIEMLRKAIELVS